jgi:hypothetical protein
MFRSPRRSAGGERRARTRRRRIAALFLAAVALVVETAAMWRHGYRMGGNVIVRCQRGHLFTTIWLPGASLKALRLGWWRLQRCPVGDHWSIVMPVERTSLTQEETLRAAETHDIRIP